MMRTEFVLAGCVLVVVGLGLCILGYQRTQPTLTDSAVSLLEQLSNQKAPEELKSDKTQGYVFLGIGAIAFLTGLGMIIASRTDSGSMLAHTAYRREGENRNGDNP